MRRISLPQLLARILAVIAAMLLLGILLKLLGAILMPILPPTLSLSLSTGWAYLFSLVQPALGPIAALVILALLLFILIGRR